jgi:hypothetical protein
MLNVVFSYCYAECRYAECRCVEYRYAEYRYAECRGAKYFTGNFKQLVLSGSDSQCQKL